MPRKAELVTGDDYGSVITAWTPLETSLLGVHPRLHVSADFLAKVRERCESGKEPWATKFATLKKNADAYAERPAVSKEDLKGDVRGLGELLCTLSLAYKLTDDAKYLDAARAQLRAMVTYPVERWDAGLVNGHWLYGHAIAYDYLFHDLDDETLALVRDNLYATLERAVDHIALHKGWMADAYACNHLPVHMAGIIAGAAAIYGEKPGVGPWLKFCIEKLTIMSMSLGVDGLSQESQGYGEYYCAFLLKAGDVALTTLGIDFMRGNNWLRNYPASQIYLALGSKFLKPGDCHLTFGDGVRKHWYGPAFLLRRIASLFRDTFAQGFAEQAERLGISAPSFLDLLWHDPSLAPALPDALPLMRHFNDKGVIASRSSWKGDEVVWAFKCGPHFGVHANSQFPHDVGGGHMQPDNGSLQIVVGNERLLATDGYFRKETAYHNTVLVNGIGQFGEGGEWFEGLELRKLQRFPRIINAQSKDHTDMVIADIAPAYRIEAGLERFVRTIIYQRPGLWLIVDELLAKPGTRFETLFHSDYAITSTPGADALNFDAKATHTGLRISALSLATGTILASNVTTQKALPISAHASAERPLLTFSSAQMSDQPVRYVTVLQAYTLGGPVQPSIPRVHSQNHSTPLLDAVVAVGPLQFTLRTAPEEPKTKLRPVT